MIEWNKISGAKSHSAIEFRLICKCTSVFVSREKYGKEIIESKIKEVNFENTVSPTWTVESLVWIFFLRDAGSFAFIEMLDFSSEAGLRLKSLSEEKFLYDLVDACHVCARACSAVTSVFFISRVQVCFIIYFTSCSWDSEFFRFVFAQIFRLLLDF